MVRIVEPVSSPEENLEAQVKTYVRLKAAAADLTKEANSIRDRLSAYVADSGTQDDTGSFWVTLPKTVDGVTSIKRERRVSHSVDENEVERILTERGLSERCYDVVPVLNQDEVMACVAEGLLTDADVEVMFPTKETWAFVTGKK